MTDEEGGSRLRAFLALHKGSAQISVRAAAIAAAVECVVAAYIYLRVPGQIGWMVFGLTNAAAFVYLFGKYYTLASHVLEDLKRCDNKSVGGQK